MRLFFLLATILLMSTTLTSCFSARYSLGSKKDQITDYNKRHKQKVATSASFEMSCPIEKITFHPLEYYQGDLEGAVTKWGARGCGKKAVYVRDDSDQANHKWILNTIIKEDSAANN